MTELESGNLALSWSDETHQAIADATKGLGAVARRRFFSAWREMLRDWDQQVRGEIRGALVESWNAYLVRVAPSMVECDHVLQLHGMFILVGDYPAALDHERIALAVRVRLGDDGEQRYRTIVSDFSARVGEVGSVI